MYNWQGEFNSVGAQLANEAGEVIGKKIGARIRMLHNGCCGGGAGYIIPPILSSNGPDVYTGCCEDFAGFVSQGMLLNLDPYLKRDNITPDIWSINQYRGFTTPKGQWALPVYAGPHVFAYDQSVLDELGCHTPKTTGTGKRPKSSGAPSRPPRGRSTATAFRSAGSTTTGRAPTC